MEVTYEGDESYDREKTSYLSQTRVNALPSANYRFLELVEIELELKIIVSGRFLLEIKNLRAILDIRFLIE